MGQGRRLIGLAGCWLGLSAFASGPQPRLPYDLRGMDEPVTPTGSPASTEPGSATSPRRLSYDVDGLLDETRGRRGTGEKATRDPIRGSRVLDGAVAVELSVVADSNFNNGTDLPVVLVDYGDGPVPVPLGADYRERSGLGSAADVTASAALPVAGALTVIGAIEGSWTNHEGRANDDASLLIKIGPQVSWEGGGSASVQLIGFQRWYGGTTLSAGGGLRGELLMPAGAGAALRLLGEARLFESDYGSELDGALLSGSLAYEAVVDPATSAAAGIFVRRQLLGSDALSSTDVGGYAGVTRYLGPYLAGSASLAISRAVFDAPTFWLAPDPRRDWRFNVGLSARARTPLLWRLHPNLAYSFGRIDSNVQFFEADRHVLRLGLGTLF